MRGSITSRKRSAGRVVASGAVEVGHFASEHRGEIATGVAIGVCLTPGVDLVGCGLASAAAYGVRASQRVQDKGFNNSLGENAADLIVSALSFGLVATPFAVGTGEAGAGLSSAFGVSRQFGEEMWSGLSPWARAFIKGNSVLPDALMLLADILAC